MYLIFINGFYKDLQSLTNIIGGETIYTIAQLGLRKIYEKK